VKRSQADRTRIAERARPSTKPLGPASTDLRARTLTVVKPSGVGIRKHKAKMTGAQRNSEGRRSEWSASQTCKDPVAMDAKWSQTVRSQNV
jgi:hypothetical protein